MKRKKKPAPDPHYFEAIVGEFGDFDWRRDCWFTKLPEGIELPSGRRFSNAELCAAAEQLAKLYTPEVCRQVIQTGPPGFGVMYLFVHMIPHIVPMIRLGLHLRDAAPISNSLAKRLCVGAEHHAAAWEVRTLAVLRRAGVEVDHEPFGKAGPDFRVLWDHREYFVEAKLVWLSDADRLGRDFERAVMEALIGLDSLSVVVRLSPAARNLFKDAAGRQYLQKEGRRIIDEIVSIVDECQKGSRALGLHAVDGLGGIVVGPPPEGYGGVDSFYNTTPEEESNRIYREFRDGARQLPCRGLGVVFVNTASDSSLDDAAKLIAARSKVTGPTFANVHFGLLRRSGRPPTAQIVPLLGATISDADLQLAEILAGED